MLQQVSITNSVALVSNTHVAGDEVASYVTFEDVQKYSVVLNLLGINQKDIFIDIDKSNNEVGIYAGKDGYNARSVKYWIFNVPADGDIGQVSMKYKGGALEITIPKVSVRFKNMKQAKYFTPAEIVA